MRQLALPAAAALLVAALAVAAFAALSDPAPSRAERGAELAAELRCPDCQGLSVADSPTASAAEIRRQVDELLAAGRTPEEVRAHFVDRYGEWILLAPSSPLPWLIPFVVLAAAAASLLVWLRRGGAAEVAPAALRATDVERARIREEVEALDA